MNKFRHRFRWGVKRDREHSPGEGSLRKGVCPLSEVKEGTVVKIKQLLACPEMCQRLREMGLCEEQQIRLLLKESNLICQICNMRLGLSSELADSILVEPISNKKSDKSVL
ncbi:MAG: ferrous iron transport protein A [Verrucomicrobiae bacterium]|nr:ferrous iron transport protein A [Verrucomicrobiae bacterium]